MKYTPGMTFDMRFGTVGGNEDRMLVVLYGDIGHSAAQFELDAACAEHPDQACLSGHQKVSFCCKFAQIRAYGDTLTLFEQVARTIETAGWKRAEAVDGLPDTGSSVNDLADTRDIKYAGHPEASFPCEPNVQGYNAAGGFTIVVEKEGTKPEFSQDEIAAIGELAQRIGQVVYGRELPEVTV